MQCPKCHSPMREYNRNGVMIEQCDTCRGIFLDYGELEHLSQMEAQYRMPPPAAPGYGAPAWGGHHGGHHGHRQRGWANMLFSS